MRSKYPLGFALFLFSAAAALGGKFVWPGHGTVSLEVPATWKLQGAAAGEIGFSLTGHPVNANAALLQITLATLPADKPVLPSELPDRLQTSLLPYIDQSVEQDFHAVPLKLRQGKGWYAELTDASLVGKPPVPDDYKVMRSALISLDRQLLVIATMQFDDPAAATTAEMLGIVSSIQFVAGKDSAANGL